MVTMMRTTHEPGVESPAGGRGHASAGVIRDSSPPDHQPLEPSDEQALFKEARRRQRLRRAAIAGVAAIVFAGIGLGVTLSRGLEVPAPPKIHTSTHAPPRLPPSTSLFPQAPSPAVPGLDRPEALAVDPNGDLLVANQGTNQVLRRLADGSLQVIAGTGVAGYSGDGGPATEAELNTPSGIAVAPDGTIYVADTKNNRVRAISPTGTISTVAGNGSGVTPSNQPQGGTSGIPAVDERLADPLSVAVGPDGQLYVADSSGVQIVSPTGMLTNLTPSGLNPLVFGTDTTTLMATAITTDSAGDLYVGDFSPKMLLELSSTGRLLNTWDVYVSESGLALAPDGSVLVADEGQFSFDRISGGHLSRIASFSLGSIAGITGTLRPSNIVATPGGTIYGDTDGANGGTDTPVLGTLNSAGQFRVLATGTNSYPEGN